MAQQSSPYVAKHVYGLIAVSGFSGFWKYSSVRLYASTVLSGSAANCGNRTERVKIVMGLSYIHYKYITIYYTLSYNTKKYFICLLYVIAYSDRFLYILQMAKPKQKRVEEAKEALQLAQKSLAKKQASLKKVGMFQNIVNEEIIHVVIISSHVWQKLMSLRIYIVNLKYLL